MNAEGWEAQGEGEHVDFCSGVDMSSSVARVLPGPGRDSIFIG